jgi:hypothetical protein
MVVKEFDRLSFVPEDYEKLLKKFKTSSNNKLDVPSMSR